ncbi:SGNH/GDSL hydrolase family protein [Acinetobacter baumannii]|uniref:SGNH/GDSL hydrolase family protein n=1 Tax=Acinetobacter baumannii TaxID=470 RepID=UPI0023410ED8|nr:SGNH/GDSL hydrolase family protein [Acinetobacter baumannii]
MAQTIVIEVPGKSISELEPTSNVSPEDLLPVVQGDQTKKAPLEQVADMVKAGLGSAASKDVTDFATPAAVTAASQASQLRDDAQNERIDNLEHGLVSIGSGADSSFSTYAEMIAYVPPKANVSVRNNDPDPELKGVYTWTGSQYVPGYDPLDAANEFTLGKHEEALEYTDSKFDIENPNLYKKLNNFQGKFVSIQTNNVASNATAAMNRMPIQAGKTYAIKSSTFSPDTFIVVLRDTDSIADGPTLGKVIFTDTTDPTVKTFTIPADSTATHAFFSVLLPAFNFDIRETCIVNEGVAVKKEVVKSISGITIEDVGAREILLPKTDLDITGELYDPTKNVSGKFVRATTGNIETSTTGVVMGQFQVAAGKTYAVRSNNFDPTAFVISLRESNSTAVGATLGKVVLNDTTNPTIKTFTVPSNSTAKYALINIKLPSISFDISSVLSVMSGRAIVDYQAVVGIGGIEVADVYLREMFKSFEITSILKDLSWVVGGDSITQNNYRSRLNYQDYISLLVGGMQIHNYGKSGTGYFDRFNIADEITQTPDEIDLITWFFGTNDWEHGNKPLGDFLDTDTETISGCINTCFTKLINKFPTKTLAVFTPLPRLNNWGSNAANNAMGYTLEQISNLIIQYAKHYSIPYLDLYHESNLPVWVPAANDFYFWAESKPAPDGLHPNDNGHKVLARKILAFLVSIVFKGISS